MSYEEKIINKVKITITPRETGIEKTILETDINQSDYLVGPVVAGIPFTEAVDETLDTFTFTIKNQNTKKPFRPFDLATLSVNDGICTLKYEMVILSDHVQTLSNMYKTYDHIVTAIESTKLLEKVKIFNLNLTNQNDSLLQQINKALTNAELMIRTTYRGVGSDITLDLERKCRFSLSERLIELLEGQAGGDFYFGNTELRSVLDGMLSMLNSRVCVDKITFKDGNISNIKLGYRSMSKAKNVTPIWTKEEQGEIVNEESENYAQDVAGKIVARGYNTLTKEPFTFTNVFKSASVTVDDTNACAFLPFPISENGIKKFKVKAYVEGEATVSTAGHSANMPLYLYLWVDIATRLIPSEQYEMLSEEKQKISIPYQIGTTIIGSGGFTEKIFHWTKEKMGDILSECLTEQYTNDELNHMFEEMASAIEDKSNGSMRVTNAGFKEISDLRKYYDLPFTISYYPQIDTVADITKPNVYDKDDILLGVMDNQSEQTLDLERHGRRLESLIKRTGNDSYYIDVQAKYYSKLLPLMAKIDLPMDKEGYTDSGYVVYKREIGVYDMFLKCRYYFSKDFNAVQQYAGVNREKHLFDIPLESDECPILLKKYLLFGSSADDGEYAYGEPFIKSALRTLFGVNEGAIYYPDSSSGMEMSTGKINYLIFTSHCGELSFPLNTENSKNEYPYTDDDIFVLPCMTYGQAHTMNFVARPLDNYSVDYSRDGYVFSIWGDKGNMITYNRYVSKEAETVGECDRFKVYYAFDCIQLINPDSGDYDNAAKQFPVVEESQMIKATAYPIEITYFKDRTQKPLFCQSIECLPREADYGKIIIGSAFCRDNNLVKENGEGLAGLKLVVSTSQTLDVAAETIPYGFKAFEYEVDSVFTLRQTSGKVNCYYLDYNGNVSDSVTAWAIVNASGEIYLAANGNVQKVYVTVSDFPK